MPSFTNAFSAGIGLLTGTAFMVGGLQLRRRNRHLLAHGRPIRGVVTKLTPLPKSNRSYRATVQYQPEGAAVHTVQVTVDKDCWPGAYLTLRYDPAHPETASLDEDVKPYQEIPTLIFGGFMLFAGLLFLLSLLAE
ncbi:DUF3592 domain-containing protein [Hymenobacter sp. CRA2]|uniref:DUF3592 domain-containing protein n=1 Tax=Hymenobacter sp. CRA2 TaxID=1955620 RepID=UPI00098F2554|nr:DUF3592 domain-containing protein [Hymenobacter sp. CRA2]OON66904.1 hypothetical protein B0919_20155 [Hymenobacter sp. CRA2]